MSNFKAGLAFKRRVLVYLLQEGLRVADPYDGATLLSDMVGLGRGLTDITGLEPWIIDVHTSSTGDMSESLNRATAAARASDSRWPVVIMGRRGHPIEDAYAVVPLHVMVQIFAGHAPSLARQSPGIGG